jgi:hypothetical protein
MALAIDCSTIVLPAFGGDTMSARQLRELGPVLDLIRVQPVDLVDAHQRVELLPLLLAVARLAHHTGDRVATTQAVAAHQRQRDVHVVGARQVARRADERVVVQHVQDPADGQQDVVLADLGVTTAAASAAVALAATPAAPAVPEPAAPATTAVVVLVGGTARPVRRTVATLAVALRPVGAAVAALRGPLATVALGVVPIALIGALLVTPRLVAALVGLAALRAARGTRRGAATTAGLPALLTVTGVGPGVGPVGVGPPFATRPPGSRLGLRLGGRRGSGGRHWKLGLVAARASARPAVRPGGGATGLAFLDRGDEVRLAHAGRTPQPQLAGKRSQFGQHHAGQAGTLARHGDAAIGLGGTRGRRSRGG